MPDLTLNSPATVRGSVGNVTYLNLDLPASGKFVLELAGTSAQVGVWGPFPPGDTPVDEPPYGKFVACGPKAWGVCTLKSGTYLVRSTLKASGTVTILLRSWKFTDYLLVYLHRSTCL